MRISTLCRRTSVYRLLKAHDLITSPAFVVITAADRFQHPTTRPNELWQTDFTYLQRRRLGLVLPLDGPRRLLAVHPGVDAHDHDGGDRCTRPHSIWGARTGVDRAAGRTSATALERQRALLRLRRAGATISRPRPHAHAGQAVPPDDPGEDRALAPVDEEPQSRSKTTICSAISRLISMPSSITTTTGAVSIYLTTAKIGGCSIMGWAMPSRSGRSNSRCGPCIGAIYQTCMKGIIRPAQCTWLYPTTLGRQQRAPAGLQ